MIFFVILLLIYVFSSAVLSDTPETSIKCGIGSGYSWHGMTQIDDIVVNPVVKLKYMPVEAELSGYINLQELDNRDRGLFSQFDFILTAGHKFNDVGIKIGYAEYLKDKLNGVRREIGTVFTVEPLSDLELGCQVWYAFSKVRDFYSQVYGSYITKFIPEMHGKVNIGVSFVGDDYAVGKDGGVQDFTIDLSLLIYPESDIRGSLGVLVVKSLDQDVLPDKDEDVIIYGSMEWRF